MRRLDARLQAILSALLPWLVEGSARVHGACRFPLRSYVEGAINIQFYRPIEGWSAWKV